MRWVETTAKALLAIVFFASFVMGPLFAASTAAAIAGEQLGVSILQARDLGETKKRLQAGDHALQPALNKLRRDADRALQNQPVSVTQKQLLPPSGDKHDYISIAPYWWPNPAARNGLPYVRRDGDINPERDQTSDRKRLDQLVQGVKTLALAYYCTENDAYARHAAKLLRAWFLDETTKMNPHLRYAQSIPGRNSGRAEGIIETHTLPEVIDALGLLQGSKGWTPSDQRQLRDWFNTYLDWLRESPEGKAEAKAQNNHGTWYDVQVASFAIFVGRDQVARQVLGDFATGRIAVQIEPAGRLPHELARTRAWNYSIFNLEAMFNAASIADQLKIDLWNYQTASHRSIRKALDWLIPFATGEKKWIDREIAAFEPQKLAPLLRRAAIVYRESAYEEAIAKLPKLTGDERWRLLYPRSLERR